MAIRIAPRPVLHHGRTGHDWTRPQLRPAQVHEDAAGLPQGLLGFAGMTSVLVKDWARPEPIFVNGLASVDAAAR